MASQPSGTAVENSLTGGSILYTDTGQYGVVSSRVLTVYDYLGNLLQTFNMGSNLTATYTFPADVWLKFVCTVTDNVSGSPWVTTIYVVAQGYYWNAYLEQFNATNCGCNGNNCNLEKSQLSLQAALRFNLAGPAGAASANSSIIMANYWVNQNIVSQLM
jgi:hypothetical protein